MLVGAAAACTVGPPNVNPPNQDLGFDAFIGTAFADSVMAYIQGGNTVSCVTGNPDCVTTMIQTGDCGDNEAVGPMDGKTWQLNDGDSITLGFRCSSITEVGFMVGDGGGAIPSPDFQIFGTSTVPSSTVVAVSVDDMNFYTVNTWGKLGSTTDPTFDLMYTTQATSMPMPLTLARYVRISQVGSGTAQIDAVESLRAIK